MVPKILNPKLKRIILYICWFLLVTPLISTYFLLNYKYVLIAMYVICYILSFIIYLVHYILHIKARDKLNSEYSFSAIATGLKKTKKLKIKKTSDDFINKQTIKSIIKSSDDGIENLDKKFDQKDFYQEYDLTNENNEEIKISCLEFCKPKRSLNYPYNYDCYYWIELKNLSGDDFVLLNNKETNALGFTKYLTNNLHKEQKEKFFLYCKNNNFDLNKIFKDQILNDLLFKKETMNVNLVNKNQKTFLLLRMSFNLFNLYYGSDYTNELIYNELVIQRIENIKMVSDLLYSLRECFNDLANN
ncbi:hypothetical protein [Mycoplasma bradburyae]|uniref:DUF3137 domain-containing protein n=1 Tax=Mycoplasma bradburyae TaxID=2963128 RepID=A0AAW6HRW6_9MOLU|nr:hypothetical protein [Mycoplasma bradburyae]MDC4183239.1 hypothetical protein [Mycoplasma bradburyae]UTS70885.1 hypothetical protein NMG77_00145 [Mycoplasma bradburyae]